jgi:hypothetical protein
MSQAPAFVEDDKLPLDVGRKAYSNTSHALCCLECGFESSFNPTGAGRNRAASTRSLQTRMQRRWGLIQPGPRR